jgi:predicted Zn-dependent protease
VALRPDQIEYRLAAEQADAAPDTPGAIDQGLRQIGDALAISPRDPMLTDERGALLLERALRSGTPQDLTAARRALAQLVAGDPNDPQDQLRLGVADAQAGDNEAAEAAWRNADRLAPTSASAAIDLATLYAGEHRWPAAAAAARQALAREPADAAAQAILAESASHLGT